MRQRSFCASATRFHILQKTTSHSSLRTSEARSARRAHSSLFSPYLAFAVDAVDQRDQRQGERAVEEEEQRHRAGDVAKDRVEVEVVEHLSDLQQLVRQQAENAWQHFPAGEDALGKIRSEHEHVRHDDGHHLRAGERAHDHGQEREEENPYIAAEHGEGVDLANGEIVEGFPFDELKCAICAASAEKREPHDRVDGDRRPVNHRGGDEAGKQFCTHGLVAAELGGKEDGVRFQPVLTREDAADEEDDDEEKKQNQRWRVINQRFPAVVVLVVEGRVHGFVLADEKILFSRGEGDVRTRKPVFDILHA